jgi:acyl-CoA dehydrogenase
LFEEKIELIAPHPIGRLRFDQCRVPAANLLGQEGQGFKIAMTTLDTFRSTVGAAAVGLAWRALDEALSYAKRRVQFGRPILEFQATQMKLPLRSPGVHAWVASRYQLAPFTGLSSALAD